MVSDKVMKRVEECHRLIDSGVAKRYAYLQAHIDQDTYNKYKDLLTTQKSDNNDAVAKKPEKLNIDTGIFGRLNVKKRGRPRKGDMKTERVFINIEPLYKKKLEEEAMIEHLPLATHIARKLKKELDREYPDLKTVNNS